MSERFLFGVTSSNVTPTHPNINGNTYDTYSSTMVCMWSGRPSSCSTEKKENAKSTSEKVSKLIDFFGWNLKPWNLILLQTSEKICKFKFPPKILKKKHLGKNLAGNFPSYWPCSPHKLRVHCCVQLDAKHVPSRGCSYGIHLLPWYICTSAVGRRFQRSKKKWTRLQIRSGCWWFFPTHLENMLVTMGSSSPSRGENKK